jgi:hypothetical protein
VCSPDTRALRHICSFSNLAASENTLCSPERIKIYERTECVGQLSLSGSSGLSDFLVYNDC